MRFLNNFIFHDNRKNSFSRGRQLIEFIKKLNLPQDEFVVFGSGAMYLNEIKDLDHDIDLLARGSAWEKATKLAKPVDTLYHKGKVVVLNNGKVEIYNEWLPGDWDMDKLINKSDLIDGIRFVNLDTVIKWKKMMNREKDQKHLKMIDAFLKKN